MVQPTSTNNADMAPMPTRLFIVSRPQHEGSPPILYHRIAHQGVVTEVVLPWMTRVQPPPHGPEMGRTWNTTRRSCELPS